MLPGGLHYNDMQKRQNSLFGHNGHVRVHESEHSSVAEPQQKFAFLSQEQPTHSPKESEPPRRTQITDNPPSRKHRVRRGSLDSNLAAAQAKNACPPRREQADQRDHVWDIDSPPSTPRSAPPSFNKWQGIASDLSATEDILGEAKMATTSNPVGTPSSTWPTGSPVKALAEIMHETAKGDFKREEQVNLLLMPCLLYQCLSRPLRKLFRRLT